MKNKFYYYQLLDEREEQLMNKAGAESFYISIAFLLLSYTLQKSNSNRINVALPYSSKACGYFPSLLFDFH